MIYGDEGWFRGTFRYGFCPDKKSFDKLCRELDDNRDYGDTAGRCNFFEDRDGKPVIVVTIRDDLDAILTPLEMSALMTHEAIHVFQKLCRQIGETEPSDEFQAYSIQAILHNLLAAYEKTRRPLAECGNKNWSLAKKPVKSKSGNDA